jgi:hypothetical protein
MSDTPRTTLTDGSPVTDDHREIDPATGMQKGYVVLSEEERAKGYVRPLRKTYTHVGKRPKYPLTDLNAEKLEMYKDEGWIKYEKYPEGVHGSALGRYWSQADLDSGCGGETKMSWPLAETYACNPKFYSGTFCSTCKKHFDLEEFVWSGTNEQVGS